MDAHPHPRTLVGDEEWQGGEGFWPPTSPERGVCTPMEGVFEFKAKHMPARVYCRRDRGEGGAKFRGRGGNPSCLDRLGMEIKGGMGGLGDERKGRGRHSGGRYRCGTQ